MKNFDMKYWDSGFKAYTLKDLKIIKEKKAINELTELSNNFHDDIGDIGPDLR